MSLRAYIKTRHPKLFSTLKNLRSFFSKSMEESNSSAGINDAPPPFDPLVPAIPISYPLKTLEELESRDYFKSFHYPFNKSSVSLNGDLQKRPRILVCHDMAGGYTDDRFVQGGVNSDAYAVWHWHLIDIFVYFSHNLVTLPPPCWTNTAHKHGVKILGTFIMEWDEGKKRAEKLLSTKESAHMYADRLTELAVALNFDGWLINMEVNLNPNQIPNVIEFVSHLSQTMHSSVPGSTIIWYDSVTTDGALRWQNKLNDKNKPFFDVCDGIFVNYSWKEDYPKSSADVAGDRKFDVYMGIDVFGRGTYGGGQWTTNVALDVIKKDEVSAAMFAPGWVYETKQPPDFRTAQNRWWGLVEKSWGVVQNYPKVLPFYSNFNQGHGYHIYIDGEQVSNTPWNNISSQSFQPYIEYTEDPATQPIQVAVDFKDSSYSGGGSIKFKGTLGDGNFTARLFQSKLLLGSSPLIFTYSVKLSGNSLLGLALTFSSADNEKKSVLLASSGDALVTFNQFSKHFTNVIMPHQVKKKESGWVIQESSIEMDRHTLREIRALCYRAPSRDPSDYYAVIGDISVKTSSDNSNFPPSMSWEVDSQYVQFIPGPQGSKNLSFKIIWKLKSGNVDTFSGYNIYVKRIKNASSEKVAEQEYLGVAKVESFYISDLLVPSGTSDLKFIIQVCSVDGASQLLDDSPSLILKVEAA